MRYVEIMKLFIYAERIHDWEKHLYCVSEMLNLFAATGHGNYAKCGRLYLQEMQNMNITHPELYESFMNGDHTARRTQKFWNGIWTDLCIEQTLMRSIKSRGGLTSDRGLSESSRNLWVLSLTSCANVHNALMDLIISQTTRKEAHVELRASRKKVDFKDCTSFYSWLTSRNPFLIETPHLYSLSTGVVSKQGQDNVNCERAEDIGQTIQQSFDNLPLSKCKLKRSELVVTLSYLKLHRKKKQNNGVSMDPCTIFNRLLAVAGRLDSVESAFEFELTPEPLSLFKNSMMRKADKAALRNLFLPSDLSVSPNTIERVGASFIDGDALLHRVRWDKGNTFKNIATIYVKYIKKHYLRPTVIFDGYEGTTAKSHEHLRRNCVPMSTYVDIREDSRCVFNQDRYFSLTENKSTFIKFLSFNLKSEDIAVINCYGEADTNVVSSAIAFAKLKAGSCAVIADDTDIAVMLLHHWTEEMDDVYFVQQRTLSAWSIRYAERGIKDIKSDILFLHAFTGCDSTSAIFSKGKVAVVKLFRKCKVLQGVSKVFMNDKSTPEEIAKAAALGIKAVYKCAADKSLGKIRYQKYIDMSCRGNILPEKLPPTERASCFHGLRVFYQIMQWRCIDEEVKLNLLEWGWKKSGSSITPITTDLAYAPSSLQHIIRCNCKSSRPCSSNACTCRKHGISCLPACGECRGEDCFNCVSRVTYQSLNEDSTDEDDM